MTSPGTSLGPPADNPLDAEALLQRFEQSWRYGTPPSIDDYLPSEGASDPRRRALLEELVMLDLEYRWRRATAENGLPKAPGRIGEQPRLEEYVHCYPELGPLENLSGELIGAEYRVRQRWGDRPERTEYAARFGRHSALLSGALNQIDQELAEEFARDRTVPLKPLAKPVAQPAPPPLTVASLVDLLRRYRLLSPPQLDEVVNRLQQAHSQPRPLAGELLQRGWLTVYQNNQLFFHNGQDLALGPYLLIERLGEGGTGQVFKARHRQLRRTVALKVIRRELLAEPEVVRRFYREVRVLSGLSHPNVVQAYDAGPIGETHFLEMEYVHGTDLAKLVRDIGPLPVSRAIDYARQAALGLDHIHQHGLVHRDIKPHNLLLMQGDESVVKVLDLGLARFGLGGNGEAGLGNSFTPVGAVLVGTLDYMAPEQALDFHQADIRADIYSLGCTLYFLLAGQAPFSDGTVLQRLLRHQHDEPPAIESLRSDLPPELSAVLRRMLAKRPEDRFQTPAEAAQALAPLMEGERVCVSAPSAEKGAIDEPRPSRSDFSPKSTGRFRTAAARYVLPTAGLLLLGVGAVLWIGHSQPRGTAIPPTGAVGLQPGAVVIEAEPLALLPGAPLSKNALVSRPAPVEGVRSWTIETRGPRGAVMGLVYSPDGRWLATSSEDQVIRLWQPTATPPLARLLVGHEHLGQRNQRLLLAWSPDSRYLASGGQVDRTVRLWEIETGRPLRTISLPGPIMSLTWSPDGRKLACGCQAQTAVLLLDPTNGRLFSQEGHRGSIGALQWSPDGAVLASGSEDRTIRLWDAVTGRTLQTLTGPAGSVTRLAWSPDGKTLAAAALPDGAVRLWEMASGKQLSMSPIRGTVDLAWAPDGKTLALCGDGLHLWEPDSGQPPRPVKCDMFMSAISWSPDGKVLAAGGLARSSGRGVVEMRDAATGMLGQTFDGHPLWTTDRQVIWSRDGCTLAAVDYPSAGVSLWDAANGRCLAILSGHNKKCLAAAWSPNGPTLATSGDDNHVCLWDTVNGKLLCKFSGHTGPVTALVWSPDGKALASGSSDRTVRTWDVDSRKSLRIMSGHKDTVGVLAWSPDGKILAAGGGDAERTVRWWDPATGDALHQPLSLPREPSALAWSADGKWLAAGMRHSGTALVWDRTTGRLAKTLSGQQTGTVALNWLAGDTILAATCTDRKLRQWDIESEQLLRATELAGVGTFSPDRRTLAQLSWPLLQLWDADSARRTGAFLLLDREHWISLNADGQRWATTFPQPGKVGSPQWICVMADGHYRTSATMESQLAIVVQTEHSQETLAPKEFERKYGWKNDSKRVKLLGK